MSEGDAHVADFFSDWNLLLVASSTDGPERTLQYLSGALSACGAWILSRGNAGRSCVELDFEFPRTAAVEIYAVLVACGLTLSREAHLKLTELCHCTGYVLASKGGDVVRLHLTTYTDAQAGELEGGEDEEGERRAA